MNDVYSIIDYPPAELCDLRDAIREQMEEPTDYWHSLVLGAAQAWYTQEVKRHYDEKHADDSECDCT